MKDIAVPASGLANLRHAERFPWHVASTAVPISFLFILSNQPLSIVKNACNYTHTSDCVQTVYELPLLPNNTANETYFHKSWAVRGVAWKFSDKDAGLTVSGWIRDIGQNVLKSSLQTGSSTSPSYFQIFFLIAFLLEAYIGKVSIHYII
jgi:hypothetical protein